MKPLHFTTKVDSPLLRSSDLVPLSPRTRTPNAVRMPVIAFASPHKVLRRIALFGVPPFCANVKVRLLVLVHAEPAVVIPVPLTVEIKLIRPLHPTVVEHGEAAAGRNCTTNLTTHLGVVHANLDFVFCFAGFWNDKGRLRRRSHPEMSLPELVSECRGLLCGW